MNTASAHRTATAAGMIAVVAALASIEPCRSGALAQNVSRGRQESPRRDVSPGGGESPRGDASPRGDLSPSPLPRARPPRWDAGETLGVFFRDALQQGLISQQPGFGQSASGVPGQAPRAIADPAARSAAGDRLRWSTIVSADTLEDEVKASRLALEPLLASPQRFAAGGRLQAGQHFAVLAVLMAVIRDYDGKVRWNRDAPAALPALAEAASLAGSDSPQAYATAKACQAQLQQLVSGARLATTAGPAPAGWDQLVDRALLMQRLEQATDQRLAQWTATPAESASRRAAIVHESQVVAVLATVLTLQGLPDASDQQYVGYCRRLAQAARDLAEWAGRDRSASDPDALQRMRASCVDCHQTYRG